MSNLAFERHRAMVESDIHTIWTPHPGQVPICRALFYWFLRYIFMQCGRKFGKTEFAVYAMWMMAMLFPRSQVYFIADTIKHAKELVWANRRLPDFFSYFDPKAGESEHEYQERRKKGLQLDKKWVSKKNDSEARVYLTNGSFIGCEGAENFANADGLNPHFIVYDEYKSHDYRFHEAMEPNLDTNQAPCLALGTPPDNFDNNYCKTRDDIGRMKDGRVFYLPSYLNPILYPLGVDDPKFLAKKAQYEARGDWDVFQREYMARIIIGGAKAIFPVFKAPEIDFEKKEFKNHTMHVRPAAEIMAEINKFPRDWDYYCSSDPGTTVCFAVLIIAINRYDRRVRVVKEIYEKDQRKTSTKTMYPRTVKIMEEVCADTDRFSQIYDSAAAWYENEVANEYDVGLIPCTKDRKNKEDKLGQIKDMMLVEGMFAVSDECYWFIWEITNYIKDKNGKIPEVNDHLIDDFRYILNQDNWSFIGKEQFLLLLDRRGFTMEEDQRNEHHDGPDDDLMEEYYE